MSTFDEKPVQQIIPGNRTEAPQTPQRTMPARQPADLGPPGLATIEDVDSATTLTPTASNCPTPRSEDHHNPSSPFYCHPTTRTSLDLQKTECKPIVNVYNVDVEKLEKERPTKHCRGTSGRASWAGCKSRDGNAFGCSKRTWSPMKGMDPRKKLFIKILIIFIIIAAAVGIGIGVSRAVGAGVWKSAGQYRPIGNSNSLGTSS